MPRALKDLDITLGLAVIPVQLFTATSPQVVSFHPPAPREVRLPDPDPARMPHPRIVPREETVRGYEINKDSTYASSRKI
jgi:non-homologous end joining protein Ku